LCAQETRFLKHHPQTRKMESCWLIYFIANFVEICGNGVFRVPGTRTGVRQWSWIDRVSNAILYGTYLSLEMTGVLVRRGNTRSIVDSEVDL
jgi:hypothetical protein